MNAKARVKLMASIELSEDARKVYACLELATMGYKQEVAVTMEGGKKRLLTTGDISRQTGLSERYVRYALTELEENGLGDRRAVDGGKLRRGKVEILSWAIPRPVDKSAKPEIAAARGRIPEWFPDSWDDLAPFVKRMKLHLPADIAAARGLNAELIERGKAAARVMKEAEIEVRAVVHAVCALGFQEPYKEKGTERNSERNKDSDPEPFPAPGDFSEETISSSSAFFSEPMTTDVSFEEITPSTAPALPQTAPLIDLAETLEVQAVMRKYSSADLTSARNVIRGVRRNAPTATIAHICEMVDEKGPAAKRADRSRVGLLVTAVPNAFEGWTPPVPPKPPPQLAEAPPGFWEAYRSRIGDGSLNGFRAASGNPGAEIEDWFAAQEALEREFGIARG